MTLTSLSFLPGENERIELVNSQGPFDPSWSRPQLGSLCCWAPPHVFLPSSPSARSEHLILPRIFTCCFYMQRGTEKPPKHLSLPAIPDPALESLGQRGCLLCLRSLQRTAGEPSVSASHPRGSPRRVEVDAVPIPSVRSLRTLPGGHLGSVPSQRERPGCCQVSTVWGGGCGAGHLGLPLTSTFNPVRPSLSLPSVWPRWEVPAPSCPTSAPNYRLHRLCTPAYIYHPTSQALSWVLLVLSATPGVRGWKERGWRWQHSCTPALFKHCVGEHSGSSSTQPGLHQNGAGKLSFASVIRI